MITQIKLDESTKLEFGVSITGADSQPTARFIIEGKEFSIMIPCKQVNENVEVEIPSMKKFFTSGEYQTRLEIILDNKIYTPLSESIVFEPSVEIATKQKPVALKETVKVSKVTVKKTQLDEHLLRKTQAAIIIAKSLGYTPELGETPSEIIEHALENVGTMTQEQANTVNDMLDLAESVGIKVNRVAVAEYKPIITEVKQTAKQENKDPEDDLSDEELDSMIKNLDDEDILSAYEDDEFAVIDDETGEKVNESELDESELNEVLSRVERMKAKIRMAKTKTKREAKLKIALRRHSSGATLNNRARRLAVKAMEKKIAKKPLNQLSVAEKERVERIIANRKAALSRLAMKMVPHIRQIEKDRLAHHSFTQK